MKTPDLETESQKHLRAAQRVVIKFGTSLVTASGGDVSAERIGSLVDSIAALKNAGRQVVLVSSGAVGLGAGRLGLHESRLKDVVVRQACASVGQSLLMHAYEQLFRKHDVKIAQVLLTEDDFTNFSRYTNLRRTMEKLLKLGVLPIINENDTVSTAELEYDQDSAVAGRECVFGDNDRLAALVASKLEANALILLTNVDGLFLRRPRKSRSETNDEEAAPIPLVEEITDELKANAEGPSVGGRGGMLTKLEAAQIAMQGGGGAVNCQGNKAKDPGCIFAGQANGNQVMFNVRNARQTRRVSVCPGVRGGKARVKNRPWQLWRERPKRRRGCWHVFPASVATLRLRRLLMLLRNGS